MKNSLIAICAAALTLSVAAPVYSQSNGQQGQGKAIVTVLPKHDGDPLPASVTGQDLSVRVNGKPAKVTAWKPLQSPENRLELVIFIDSSSRNSLMSQFDDIVHFIKALPPHTKVAIAYMESGSADFAGPFSEDLAKVASTLHMPPGSAGSNATPYVCLSDLAKHWPSVDREARREVVMVTDGIDNFETQFDLNDPYVQASIRDALQARLVVYSIYWQAQGRTIALGRGAYENSAGQSLLLEVSQATGGKCFWVGMGNPVSFQPFLNELSRRLRNQYELGFTSRLDGKPEVETFKLKLSAPGTEVDAPEQVFVFPADVAEVPAQK